jgi:hypothetical protein
MRTFRQAARHRLLVYFVASSADVSPKAELQLMV